MVILVGGILLRVLNLDLGYTLRRAECNFQVLGFPKTRERLEHYSRVSGRVMAILPLMTELEGAKVGFLGFAIWPLNDGLGPCVPRASSPL